MTFTINRVKSNDVCFTSGKVDAFLFGGNQLSVKAKNYISIALFAFLGGIARAALNANLNYWGTFLGNISGCFLLAFLTYFFLILADFDEWLSVGLGTGFIGAFTTFSTFNLDTLKLLQAGNSGGGLLYFISSLLFGFLAAYVGMILGKKAGQASRKERR